MKRRCYPTAVWNSKRKIEAFIQMMDESVRLLIFQQQLEKEAPSHGPFVGLSVNETIKSCIVNGIPKKADKMKSDWKVPDKRSIGYFCKTTALIKVLQILVSEDTIFGGDARF